MSKWIGVIPLSGRAGYTVQCGDAEVEAFVSSLQFPVLGPFDSVEEANAAVMHRQPHIFKARDIYRIFGLPRPSDD